MSTLSEHVSLTITQNSSGITRAGFGTALILSYNATYSERVRIYGDLLDLAADFAAGTPEYRAAQAYFGQSPHPEQVMVGRGALKPTQQYTVTVQTVTNSRLYSIHVAGAPGVTEGDAQYTSDSSATTPEIANGLVTALNAVVGKNYTATFAPLPTFTTATFTADSTTDICTATAHGFNTGDGPFELTNAGGGLPAGLATLTDYWVIKIDANTFYFADTLAHALAATHIDITSNGTGTQSINADTTLTLSLPFLVTGSAAGNWFSLECANANIGVDELRIAQTHADPGVATDLSAIRLENDDWYTLITTYNSKLYTQGAAAVIQAAPKLYIFDTNETASLKTVVTNGDLLDAIHTSAYSRVAGAYHPSPANMLAAAWYGAVLPLDPGSETWKFKTLAGVAAVTLTATDRTNLRARKANTYQTVAGRNITWEGTTADGDFIDIQRGLDWLEDDMQKGVFGALVASPKVPYTNAGIALIENEVRASLTRAVNRGILASDPVPLVSAPLAADVSSSDRALRNLPNVSFQATLAGAIHKVIIDGTVSV